MSTRTVADGTQRELNYRKRLIEIANMINSAPSIQEILVEIKDKVLDLVDAQRVTIFALDTKNQELFSLFKAGQEVKEIRVPKTFGSIAGFTALSRKTASVLPDYDVSGIAAGIGVDALTLSRDAEIETVLPQVRSRLEAGRPVLVDVAIDYSRKTFFTSGVVKTNLLRFSWPDRLRFIGRAVKRKLLG